MAAPPARPEAIRSTAIASGAAQAPDADPYGLAVADAVSRLRRAMRRAARAHGGSGQPGAQPGTAQPGTAQPGTAQPGTLQPGTLPGGLSVAQLEFLSCLAENPGARPGQLARLLRLAPSSVATLVNGLSRRQLIKRIGGVADRRTAELSLTAGGSGVVASWQEVNAFILTVALASLEPASREALQLALPALRELTGAVDALADEPRADEPRADEAPAGGP